MCVYNNYLRGTLIDAQVCVPNTVSLSFVNHVGEATTVITRLTKNRDSWFYIQMIALSFKNDL